MNPPLFAIPMHFYYQSCLVVQSIDAHAPTPGGDLFSELIKESGKQNFSILYFKWQSFEKMKEEWIKKTSFILAAGGIVISPEARVLTIFRQAKWDLPKGKVEMGEDVHLAALREVKEETGVDVQLNTYVPFDITYHLYHNPYCNGHFSIKQTMWYVMKIEDNRYSLTPQREEGIEQVDWCSEHQWRSRRNATYSIIDHLMTRVFSLL